MLIARMAILFFVLHIAACSSTRQSESVADRRAMANTSDVATVTFKRVFSLMGAAGPVLVLDRGTGIEANGFAVLLRPEAKRPGDPFAMFAQDSVLFLVGPYLGSLGFFPGSLPQDLMLFRGRELVATVFIGSRCFEPGDIEAKTNSICDTRGKKVLSQQVGQPVRSFPTHPDYFLADVMMAGAVGAGSSVTWIRPPGTLVIDVVAGNRSGGRYASSQPTEVRAGRSYRVDWEMLSGNVQVIDVTD